MNALKQQMSLPLLALLAALLTTAGTVAAQSSYDLRSPDNRIEIRIRTVPAVRYDVLLKGRALLQDCTLSLDIDTKLWGWNQKSAPQKNAATTRPWGLRFVRSSPGFARTRMNCASKWKAATPLSFALTTKAPHTDSKHRFLSSR